MQLRKMTITIVLKVLFIACFNSYLILVDFWCYIYLTFITVGYQHIIPWCTNCAYLER